MTSWDARPQSLVAGPQAILQKWVPTGSPCKEDKKGTGEPRPRPAALVDEAAAGAFPKWFLLMLLACFSAVSLLRHVLHGLAQQLQGEAVASAALTAIVTGTSLQLWRHAEEMVQTRSLLETTRGEWKHGIVCLETSILGSALQLSLEEALGLAAALAQLAPVFLFENWGIHGPASKVNDRQHTDGLLLLLMWQRPSSSCCVPGRSFCTASVAQCQLPKTCRWRCWKFGSAWPPATGPPLPGQRAPGGAQHPLASRQNFPSWLLLPHSSQTFGWRTARGSLSCLLPVLRSVGCRWQIVVAGHMAWY